MNKQLTKMARVVKNAVGTEPQTQIFCQLSKVDVQNRTVYGRAVQEVPDASGEIFDYKSSKPHFEKWVDETKEASKGKSLGNIRAMHGNIAAGKAVEVTFHDDECAIDIAAKIIDDNEWEKVQEGVYTGFSIGGVYVGEKIKEGDLMRYTAAPVEISLVDKPCIPTAMFSDIVKSKGYKIVRADGAEEHAEFAAKSLEVPTEPAVETPPVVEEEPSLEIEGSAEEVAELHRVMSGDKLTLGKVVSMVKSAIKADAPKRFADTANKKYPLDNNEQVLAAWYFVNTEKAATAYKADELTAIKAEIVAAYKERFDKDPEGVTSEEATKALSGATLEKGFYQLASATSMLNSLSYFMADMEYYEESGAVPDGVAGKVITMISAMGDVITMLITDAVNAEKNTESELRKSMSGIVEMFTKAGARNSKTDLGRIQKAHDLMNELGAGCSAEKVHTGHNKSGDDPLQKALDRINAVEEEMKVLKATPKPAKAILKVVAKSADAAELDTPAPEMSEVRDRDGKVDAVATAIKMTHSLGGRTNVIPLV